jgi:NADH-quinone oxidoreductase subunit M
VVAMVYALRMMQLAFHGTPRETWNIPDLTVIEMTALLIMIIALVWLGLFPQAALSILGGAPSTQSGVFLAPLAKPPLGALRLPWLGGIL